MSAHWRAIPPLPNFVSLVPDPKIDLPIIVGISLRGIVRSPTKCLRGGPRIAVLLGRDGNGEKVWRQLAIVGQRLHSAGYVAVVAPAFSNWDDFSPADALLNLARTGEAAKVLNESIPAIPTIVGRTRTDAKRWAEFLAVSDSPAVALHTSTHRFDFEWSEFMTWVNALQEEFIALNYRPHLLVCGPSTIPRIFSIGCAWEGPLTLMSEMPYQVGRSGRILDELLTRRSSTLPKHDLIESNAALMSEVVGQLLDRAPYYSSLSKNTPNFDH